MQRVRDEPDGAARGGQLPVARPHVGGVGGQERVYGDSRAWDRQRRRSGPFAQADQHVATIAIRQHQIENDEPDFVFFEKAFVYIDVSANPPFGACNKAVIPTG